jgi:DNA-binding XRE family transcriptional regulator
MKLSDGEKLAIDRRRRGLTQAAAGARLGVTQALYSMWESDKVPYKRGAIPQITPDKYEKCFLQRRRLGLTQQRVAVHLGVPITAVIACELSEPLPALSAHRYLQALKELES